MDFKSGDEVCRAFEEGRTLPVKEFVTDGATASRISSTDQAVSELALGATSGARPNRIAELLVGKPINAKYGLIKDGGQDAYQYYIDTRDLGALTVSGGFRELT